MTGEESAAQVKLRAARVGGAEGVEILAETDLDAICATLEAERPAVCVIDSVQTLWSSEVGSVPGSVSQVREASARLLRVANYRAESFNSPILFLESLAEHVPDCVVLDLQMPMMTGVELQEQLLRLANPPPVIIITAHDQPTTRERCLSSVRRFFRSAPVSRSARNKVIPPRGRRAGSRRWSDTSSRHSIHLGASG